MEYQDDTKERNEADEHGEVLERALLRFDECAVPQQEQREKSLEARRFVSIPGAQWEGDFGLMFPDGIRLEINKTGRAIRKIETDYRSNRIIPEFRPQGGDSDDDTASTLNDLHRADSQEYKAQEARDNAFSEAIRGGFGAYRLANVLEDEEDPENDNQRINPGMVIADADQCVYFDHQARRYDKSDARFAFVITEWTYDAFKEEFGDECMTDWPDSNLRFNYDWFRADVVRVAEYYEVLMEKADLHVFKNKLTQEVERFWEGTIDRDAIGDWRARGWVYSKTTRNRRTVNKYVLSGGEILSGPVRIAGKNIPIVPVYGQREFVDGMERFKGDVQDKIDSQRLYNSNVSRLMEINASSPGETPIFAPSQMEGDNIKEMWARRTADRPAYLLANPLLDDTTGQMVSAGPTGTLPAPQLEPVTAALLQISNTDLTETDVDGAETVKANTSAEAMDIAAARVDAKSGIYLDNMRQSVQREAEIYLDMSVEVYSEPGRVVETMTEEGGDGTAILHDKRTDKAGVHGLTNDFSRGRYKVVASVTEATATRRDKTVRSSLNMADVALKAGDQDLAKAAILTAIANTEGEGMDDFKALARNKGLEIGLFKPTEDEKQALEQAAEQAGQDPNATAMMAQAEQLKASALKDTALAEKAKADTMLSQARAAEIVAGIGNQAPANDPPMIRRGFQLGQ